MGIRARDLEEESVAGCVAYILEESGFEVWLPVPRAVVC